MIVTCNGPARYVAIQAVLSQSSSGRKTGIVMYSGEGICDQRDCDAPFSNPLSHEWEDHVSVTNENHPPFSKTLSHNCEDHVSVTNEKYPHMQKFGVAVLRRPGVYDEQEVRSVLQFVVARLR